MSFELDQFLSKKEEKVTSKQGTINQPEANSGNSSPVQKTPDLKDERISVKPFRSIRIPLLSLDVNLGHGRTEKLIIYEGDSSRQIA